MEKKIDVTIVGGGFAGLAAAIRLAKAGINLRLLEKRAFLGGRAYSFTEPKTGQVVDNGQHLLMGAYHETFAFLKELGTLHHLHIQPNLAVTYAEAFDQFNQLQCPTLPAPFHLGWGLLKYRGLNLKDKWAMAQLVKDCKKNNTSLSPRGRGSGRGGDWDHLSVQDLFSKTHQTPNAIQKFWEPLVLATLNEPMEQASAELLREVIRRAFLAKRQDSSLVIPKVGFSELYAKPAQEYLEGKNVPIDFQTQVSKIQKQTNDWEIITQQGEKIVSQKILMSIPPNALQKILESSGTEYLSEFPYLNNFSPAPIVSINLWFENFNPSDTFIGLLNSPLHWVFNKTRIFGQEHGRYISIVVSGASELTEKNKEELVQLAEKELTKFYPELKEKKLIHAQVIKEKEATYSGQKNLMKHRPNSQSPFDGLYLAGDWTDTGLPATIESAVASGHQAAKAILQKNRGC